MTKVFQSQDRMVIGGGGRGQSGVGYLFLLRELMHLQCIRTQKTYRQHRHAHIILKNVNSYNMKTRSTRYFRKMDPILNHYILKLGLSF